MFYDPLPIYRLSDKYPVAYQIAPISSNGAP